MPRSLAYFSTQVFADLAVQRRENVLVVAKEEWQADEAQLFLPIGERSEIAPDQIESADLDGLGALAQTCELACRKDFDLELAAGLLGDEFGKAFRCDVDQVARREMVRQP